MTEKGLRVLEVDKTFIGKLTNTLTKMLIPTRVGINGMLITLKRNNLLKAFENANNDEIEDLTKKAGYTRKYEDTYALYLEAIDKYIMDSIYKKVKNDSASNFEKEALSKYYAVVHLKETQYLEYKYRKQKYLLELDYETVKSMDKPKVLEKYKKFYAEKMDTFYKGILKNYSVQLADNIIPKQAKEEIYNNIFSILEEYITQILSIKIEIDDDSIYKEIVEEYDKFNIFLAGKLDEIDIIEKKMVLLGISRKLFTHSLPLVAAEQCYIKLLKETRAILVGKATKKKKENAYAMLIKIIEDYNIKLLSTKIYWDKPAQREAYRLFWEEYNTIRKIKNEKERNTKKEILFIKNDLKALNTKKDKYAKIVKLYKEKLVELGVMRNIPDRYKTLQIKLNGRKVA